MSAKHERAPILRSELEVVEEVLSSRCSCDQRCVKRRHSMTVKQALSVVYVAQPRDLRAPNVRRTGDTGDVVHCFERFDWQGTEAVQRLRAWGSRPKSVQCE